MGSGGHNAGVGVPGEGELAEILADLHAEHAGLRDGLPADYIPELAQADPDRFAIAVATVDGRVVAVGDAGQPFTIQSVSKPFVYGHALQACGRAAVLSRVGVEPTGDAFNSIIRLDAANRPHNPCVNAGAIAVTSLLGAEEPAAGLRGVLDVFELFAGRRLSVDLPVFISERTHGHRNRAIAHLMRHFQMIDGDVDAVLDLYFQQCSIQVDCKDLAVMGATLAANGTNPISGRAALDADIVRDVLSVMLTCGMYDSAGQWAFTVGLPAKSGISGAILAVAPGKMGLAVYSPPVDERGHSVRGMAVLEELARRLGLHLFDTGPSGPGAREGHTAPVESASPALQPSGYTPDRGRAPPEPPELPGQ